ncbi:unnamed protein product [Mucor hiemalis]
MKCVLSRQKKTIKSSTNTSNQTEFKCTTCCTRTFLSNKQLKSHVYCEQKKRRKINPPATTTEQQVDQVMADVSVQETSSSSSLPIEDNINESFVESNVFDPFAPKTYKSSANFAPGDEGHA